MKKKLEYYDFNIDEALEKEFAGNIEYEKEKRAKEEYCRRIDEYKKEHPNYKQSTFKNKKYQWRKELFVNINFDFDYYQLQKKYQKLKMIIIVNVDGRKMRNHSYIEQIRRQAAMAVELGDDYLLTNSRGGKAPILEVIRY